MSITVVPVTFTKVNWDAYEKSTHPILGFSLTRACDAVNLQTTKAAAFIASLSWDQNPNKHLAHGRFIDDSFKHVLAGFLITADYTVCLKICAAMKCPTKMASNQAGDAVILASATLYDWVDILVQHSQPTVNKDLRVVANMIYECFAAAGFEAVWKTAYMQVFNTDGTFTWKPRHGII
jgi:hypothetical protein